MCLSLLARARDGLWFVIVCRKSMIGVYGCMWACLTLSNIYCRIGSLRISIPTIHTKNCLLVGADVMRKSVMRLMFPFVCQHFETDIISFFFSFYSSCHPSAFFCSSWSLASPPPPPSFSCSSSSWQRIAALDRKRIFVEPSPPRLHRR